MARSLFLCISLRTRAQGNVKKRTAARRTSEAEKIGSTGPVKSLQPSAFFLRGQGLRTGDARRLRLHAAMRPRGRHSPASRRRFPWPSAFPHPFRRDRRNWERPASPHAFTQQCAPRPVCSPASRRRFPWPSAFPHPFRRDRRNWERPASPHAFTQQCAPRPVCSPASRRRFLKVF